ncbi:hypothetical protein [Pseudomonas sp. Leaf434]|uniref:hypothetical protein n=1 Tax=Pseudomonas sp. Leaf434 TaxID=1736376 RepID=UPI0006F314E7|nr:hypothetical protein [Pseudomonas sp. Leaf434]KQT68028.1 hypothetical protein ASG55_09160 [Pseudomonas sp. Leaf434]
MKNFAFGRTPEKGEKAESFVTRAKKFCNASARGAEIPNPRNYKALNNQGFVVSNMAEAMGFELMDLLQSTVFKTSVCVAGAIIPE